MKYQSFKTRRQKKSCWFNERKQWWFNEENITMLLRKSLFTFIEPTSITLCRLSRQVCLLECPVEHHGAPQWKKGAERFQASMDGLQWARS
jgi:hypothetical protein